MKKIFNVALYVRLSREDTDKQESNSVVNQKKLLSDYVNKSEDLYIHDYYVDDGFTGTNFDRPSFKRMITDIELGVVNCVIVKDLSRFGRDYIDTGRYLERYFREKDIRFISISDNIDTIKEEYDMFLPIKNIFNEQYAKDISNKIHTTIKSKQNAGEFIGSFACYGYKKSKTDKNKLVIDEYPASIVRRIFNLYIQGYGKLTIAKMLNKEGVLSPTEYKKTVGLKYKNPNNIEKVTYWSYSTINHILNREMYIGNMVQGTRVQKMRGKQKIVDRSNWIIVQNTHEPIIDKQTWDRVKGLLHKRTRDLNLKNNISIFAGFIKCGDCGSSMSKNSWRLSDSSISYYFNCGTYRRYGKNYCTSHAIELKVLEEIIISDLRTIIKSVDNLKELLKSQNGDSKKIKSNNDIEINKLKLELEKVRKLKKSVYEDYKIELISKEDFILYREDYSQREKLYIQQIQCLENKKDDNETNDIIKIPWVKRLLELRDIDKLDRDIISQMIDEISIYEDNTIKITYNFSDELESLFCKVYEKKK